ncbi:endo alpha-1,4 polygalactosaminidase [Streptomyces fulvoviolaceus]|uniref:endo alpha-1,4 polygalactosaminidase n=1 Tax=Streptomyces fulvoviolaceus TaxID=285535 RepID=UPI0004C50A51|nr:endo alpha-1,4 polygalactosaminidase [Streptomyces fulvoviolaceus]
MPAKGVFRVGGLGTAVGACVLLIAGLSACGSSGKPSADASRPSASTGSPPEPSGSTGGSSTPSGSKSAAPKPSGTPERTPDPTPTPTAGLRLPPRHAGFDYQIGGAYPPPSGVRIVSRDRTAAPAPGLYNICYVNAFQVQPGEGELWPRDLVLRDGNDKAVVDGDWGEALLDIGTAAKRKRVVARINRWIDGCADKGFDAVEPDNYDSYTRSRGLLTANDATAFITLLARHAHARQLAIAQKNTVELADRRKNIGLDFAVAEECGTYDECGAYAKAFDDRVVVIEYTDSGLRKARSGFGDRLSIVRRDVMVSTPGSDDYVRKVR